MAASVAIKAVILLSLVTFSIARQFPDFVDRQILVNTLEHLDKMSHNQQWLESVMQNDSFQNLVQTTVSNQCFVDLMTWMKGLWKKEMWAIQSE